MGERIKKFRMLKLKNQEEDSIFIKREFLPPPPLGKTIGHGILPMSTKSKQITILNE